MQTIDARELALLKEKFSGDALVTATERVQNGEPLAYVLGEWYFYGLTFKLNSDCLIPRPDTEHIVDKAIELIPKNGNFIDLCTGSGCIGISVKKHRPDLNGYALDISEGALNVAKENAKENGTPIVFVKGDVLSGKTEAVLPLFDAVISNPPYIKSTVLKDLDVAKAEPLLALDGGDDGLMFYRNIIKNYAKSLKDDGIFIFEIGFDQRDGITDIAKENGFACSVYKDYGKNDRVAVLRRG